ncbi:Ras-related protein Rab-5A [Babesia sp. Xinjiang]|uniref:Ras-related protein Rab-5A n=1 Tax=Babesia sp. Xinjiang TaxID=462227 RepID=UPI000A24CC51|nr:Ras-related protein Rab-5A [Babesia sp. Xinjiang]ORM40150.1 Ras-related protein Rab-5A [Babesia sp. Xinjiang]
MTAKKSYKTVLLGDASVGKSSFAVRLTRGEFSDSTNSTIGAAFFTHTVRCNTQGSKGVADTAAASRERNAKRTVPIATSSDDAPAEQVAVKFDIWDTAGQERFKSIAPIYYRGAACAIVILDISSPPSLQHAVSWVDQIRVANSNQTLVVLVANKVDLLGSKEEHEQTLANAKAYAKENSLMIVETSAKTGQNISAVFELLAQEILRNPKRYEKPSTSNAARALNVDESRSRMLKLKCCDSL